MAGFIFSVQRMFYARQPYLLKSAKLPPACSSNFISTTGTLPHLRCAATENKNFFL